MSNTTSPKRPYLLRAYFDWILDNDFTPFLVVDATYPNTLVPIEYVREGQIVLNLSPSATAHLQLGDDIISFNARFKGVPREISIPLGAVVAIYARENGDGVMFEAEPHYDEKNIDEDQVIERAVDKTTNEKQQTANKTRKSSHLKIVK